ncbi:hypothetical protein [Clostridium thermarum]|uniref:hypothetical protein n=1 Tax=Clostridium thermarum TaxID=1716543 RepID=UPI001124B7D5|nr:hypothetical protein [Clostridium thermarum]
MSRCCCKKEVAYAPAFYGRGMNNCICNFPTLVILILIVLQFSKNKNDEGYGGHGDKQVGNGVLFIIALFFLSCAGCGKSAY